MKKLILGLMLLAFVAGGATAADIYVPADYTTIEGAISNAGSGDVIHVSDGNYYPPNTLAIGIPLTLSGQSEAGVVINIPAAGSYGMTVGAHDVTLENFTLACDAANEQYPIHASGTTNPPNGYDNLTIQNVTISGAHRRTGFDIHGFNNLILNNLTSSDAYGGNGLQLTGVVGASLNNITTIDNAWGSIALYCSNGTSYLGRGCDDINIDGATMFLGEGNLFSQDEFGLVNTNITVTGYDYLVRNFVFRAGAEGYTFFQDTEANAVTLALGLDSQVPGSFITQISTGDLVIAPGMLIQPSIDAASPGDALDIPAGTFREQLYIDKDLTLSGAGSSLTTIEAPDVVDRTTFSINTWTGSTRTVDAVVAAVGATVDITGIKVDGRDTGPDNFYGVYYHECSGSVTYCEVDGITYPAGSGAQRVLSMSFSHGAGAGPYTVDVSNNVVPSFQKGGIYVGGPNMVFTVNGNDITSNPSANIAGNGIQLSYGATGTTNGNTVAGVAYTGSDWAGTGILLFESGDVVMNGDTVIGSQSGVNYSDWRWVHSHPVPVNLTFNDLVLTDNEWSFGAQLSGDQADLNVIMNGGQITGSTGDAFDIWGTDLDPWGGSYYTGWDNGDLNVTVDGLTIDDTAVDGIWTADLSGNVTNTVHGFTVRNSSFTNTVGNAVANNFTTTIDAAENYWDDPGGPVPGLKAAGSRGGAPMISPAGFDLPEYASSATVPGTLGDKAAANISGPVTFSPWYGAPLGTVPMIVGTNGTIMSAVNLANSGDTVTVAAGTYPESVSLTKSLTLWGANAGIHPAVGTHPTEVVGVRGPETILSNGYPAISPSADDITVDGFKFTGSGGRLIDTYADADNFHLTNCIFDNPVNALTQGVIQFGGGSHVDMTIDFNLFMDKGDHTIYTGGGPFDRLNISWNRFNVEGDALFWTAVPLVDGVIQGNELDGTIGGVPGVGFCTFNAGQLGNVQILDNWAHDVQFTPFQVGIIGGSISGNLFERIYPWPGYWADAFELWGGQWGTAVSTNVSVTDNIFNFNDIPGAAEPSHGFRVRGPETGPGVDGTTIVLRDNQFIDGGVRTDALAAYHQGDNTKWVDAAYNDWGDISGPYHATLNPLGTGAPVGDFVTFSPWSGVATAGATPASSGPINCNDDVTITFSYTPDTITPDLFLYNAVVRATPQVAFGTIIDLKPFTDTNESFFALDNGDGSWTITGSTVGNPSFPVTGPADLFSIQFLPVSDGTANITFDSLVLRDPDNNTIPVVVTGATIDVDCTAPVAVTDITAAPANRKVNVAWTHDGADVAYYEVWRGLWHDGTPGGDSAYPEYDDVNPTAPVRPTDRTDAFNSLEWELAGTVDEVDPNTFADTWANHDDRGVYYYEVFPVDAATNYGPVATANDRATNYWLGDVWGPVGNNPDPNGVVDVGDMDQLGDKFGLPVPTGDPINVLDVGPTDDWSRLGIPLTDDVINFEDLIVFAMNFGVVSAAKSQVPVGTAVDLVWVDYDNGTKALRLEGGRGLKGVRVTADVKVSGVTAGTLLDEQSELTFVKNVGDKLDVSVAVMGVNTTFKGTGDLFVVSTDAEITMEGLTITARAIDNSTMKVSLGAGSDAATPRVFALNGNYPNPFNPMTKISFSLPASHDVRLSVYSLDGRLVRTLLNETRGPGLHEIVWNGQDNAGRGVSSGTYFYRVEAGPYSDVKKMTLMK